MGICVLYINRIGTKMDRQNINNENYWIILIILINY